jgi:ABC-type cobalamin/Fe3+-siderophores transport system ATPase subunit
MCVPCMQDVSGAFRPNVLTALIGETGAGKTTLMDVLAGRKTGGLIEGDIRVQVSMWILCRFPPCCMFCLLLWTASVDNTHGLCLQLQGHPKVQETFRRTMGYVEQNDIHSPNTTVCKSRL